MYVFPRWTVTKLGLGGLGEAEVGVKKYRHTGAKLEIHMKQMDRRRKNNNKWATKICK